MLLRRGQHVIASAAPGAQSATAGAPPANCGRSRGKGSPLNLEARIGYCRIQCRGSNQKTKEIYISQCSTHCTCKCSLCNFWISCIKRLQPSAPVLSSPFLVRALLNAKPANSSHQTLNSQTCKVFACGFPSRPQFSLVDSLVTRSKTQQALVDQWPWPHFGGSCCRNHSKHCKTHLLLNQPKLLSKPPK